MCCRRALALLPCRHGLRLGAAAARRRHRRAPDGASRGEQQLPATGALQRHGAGQGQEGRRVRRAGRGQARRAAGRGSAARLCAAGARLDSAAHAQGHPDADGVYSVPALHRGRARAARAVLLRVAPLEEPDAQSPHTVLLQFIACCCRARARPARTRLGVARRRSPPAAAPPLRDPGEARAGGAAARGGPAPLGPHLRLLGRPLRPLPPLRGRQDAEGGCPARGDRARAAGRRGRGGRPGVHRLRQGAGRRRGGRGVRLPPVPHGRGQGAGSSRARARRGPPAPAPQHAPSRRHGRAPLSAPLLRLSVPTAAAHRSQRGGRGVLQEVQVAAVEVRPSVGTVAGAAAARVRAARARGPRRGHRVLAQHPRQGVRRRHHQPRQGRLRRLLGRRQWRSSPFALLCANEWTATLAPRAPPFTTWTHSH
ncbi:hypothetical protein FOCC_FOCC016510 [Frankliniella occidentalis]|nr:hypothetical protein FOCC_FOCC016510 [Frankliniella occidentalis]